MGRNASLHNYAPLLEAVGNKVAAALPVGAVHYFASATAPVQWLICDGTAVSRTTYADLFAVVGETFGAGDGSTTFNLPDLRGEFIRGLDGGRGIDTGRVLGSAQKGTLQKDFASGNVGGLYASNVLASDFGADAVAASDYPNVKESAVQDSSGANQNIGTYGAVGATRPRNVALLPCIFAGA